MKQKNKITLIKLLILLAILVFNIFFGFGHIKTPSMEPAIKTGSFILFEKHPVSLSPGNIVLFRYGNRTICHRLLKLDDSYIYTKGDANKEKDPKIPIKNVKGKYLFTVWKGATYDK